jgi:hypothetical protein
MYTIFPAAQKYAAAREFRIITDNVQKAWKHFLKVSYKAVEKMPSTDEGIAC